MFLDRFGGPSGMLKRGAGESANEVVDILEKLDEERVARGSRDRRMEVEVQPGHFFCIAALGGRGKLRVDRCEVRDIARCRELRREICRETVHGLTYDVHVHDLLG